MDKKPLQVLCPECVEVRPGTIKGDARTSDSGCDSCGWGGSVWLELRIECDRGHEVWNVQGESGGIL